MKVYICSNVGLDYFFLLGKTLRRAEFEVEDLYLVSEVEYRRRAKAGGVSKAWLRAKMYILYPLYLIKMTINAGDSIFVVTSNTFFAPYLVRVFGRQRIKIVNLVYDLYPDALEVAGKFPREGFFSNIIGRITTRILEESDANVFLGDALRKFAIRRWAPRRMECATDRTIHISADYELFGNQTVLNSHPSPINIHYGGQLGRMHDAESIVAVVNGTIRPGGGEINYSFNVGGFGAKYIEENIDASPDVQILPTVCSSKWRASISQYHIGLVSLSPGGASVCLPSKAYAMMGGGLAIICICPIWSDLARLISSLNAGWVINNSVYATLEELPEDFFNGERMQRRDSRLIVEDYCNVIEQILADPQVLIQKRSNAYEGVRRTYGQDQLTKQWSALLQSM